MGRHKAKPKAFKLARIRADLTQRELDRRLGGALGEFRISRIETGRLLVSDETKQQMSEILGVKPYEIFEN